MIDSQGMTEKEMRTEELRTMIVMAKKVVRHYPARSNIHQVAAFALECATKEYNELKGPKTA